MLFWIRFPFIRITALFALGIGTGDLLNVSTKLLLGFLLGTLILFLLLSGIFVKSAFRKFNMIVSVFAFLSILLSGIMLSHLKRTGVKNTERLILGQSFDYYLAEVLQKAGETEKHQKFIVKLRLIQSGEQVIRASGKILIYLPAESSIQSGDRLVVSGRPSPIKDPIFPFEFNYKKFMFRKEILFNHFLNPSEYRVMINTSRTNLLNMIFSIREQLILIIQKRIEDPAVQALMIALTTGERDYFDPETYQQFISAGIVHILAVSGLHVGIIYGILILLTRPLSLTLPGQWIRCLIIILFFLFFAVITGLSPSVVRSIIMFTILLLGITFNRKSPTLNSVFLSAFLLLCYDPGWLWLVGFQLSYAAVLGIILFNPLIQSLIRTNSRILRGIWNLISVSLAAQLTTLPLSLLYFKQFPTYFLLSNLIAIPFAGVFLPGCIIFICTHYLNNLNALAANLLEHAGKYFMQAIQLIDHLPGSVIFPVNINRLDSILLFLLLVFLIQVLQYRKQRMIKYMFFVISFIILKDVLFYFSVSGQKKMLIYSISKLPVVELIDGHQTYLITQTSGSAYLDKVKYHTLNYHIHHNLNFRIVPIDRLFENLPCFISEDYTMIYWNKKSIILTTKKLDRQDSITLRESADFIISWRNEKLQVQIPGIETGNCDAGDFHPLRRLFRKKKLPQIRNENELISVRIVK